MNLYRIALAALLLALPASAQVPSGGGIAPSYAALKKVTGTYVSAAITANVLTIDLSAGTIFNVTNNANITTLTITSVTASKASFFELYLTGDGNAYTQAWGASVKWPSAITPTVTTTLNKIDRYAFETNDGGTTWYASVINQNY